MTTIIVDHTAKTVSEVELSVIDAMLTSSWFDEKSFYQNDEHYKMLIGTPALQAIKLGYTYTPQSPC